MRIVMRLIVMSFTLIALDAMPSMAHAQGDKGKSKVAEEAFIYGFPMVMNYAVFYGYFIDKSSPGYNSAQSAL